jgi:hypothetical protein
LDKTAESSSYVIETRIRLFDIYNLNIFDCDKTTAVSAVSWRSNRRENQIVGQLSVEIGERTDRVHRDRRRFRNLRRRLTHL